MLEDILACNIGQELLVVGAIGVEHQAGLGPLCGIATVACSETRPSSKGMLKRGILLDPGDVVDAEAAPLDPLEDLVDAGAAGVFELESPAHGIAGVDDREDNGGEDSLELTVEGAVERDVGRVTRWRCGRTLGIGLKGPAGERPGRRPGGPRAWSNCPGRPAGGTE